jgi:hypothetical protein
MGLFSKTPKQPEMQRPLPTDKVRMMQRSGMSERDIIRQLKQEGFSFSEIEKAMLQSVKEGAGGDYAPQQNYQPAYTPAYEPQPAYAPRERAPMPPRDEAALPEEEPVYERPGQKPAYERPEPNEEPEMAEAPLTEAEIEEHIAPEAIMEDLIESVAHEKFEKFSSQVRHLESEFDEMKAELKHVKDMAESKPAVEMPKEWDEKIEDLETRIGGMERALKQFLPSLTDHIESLSHMVEEMKNKNESHAPRREYA